MVSNLQAKWIIGALLVLGELLVALDGNHYWHDIRFAFATTEFSLADVFAGAFNPHQAWTVSNEVSTSGFYASKMLHMVLLSAIFSAVDPDTGGFYLGVVFSVLTMTGVVTLAYVLYVQLFRSGNAALYAVACMLLAPVVPYLTGKFLAENTSLFFVVVSLVLFMRANIAVTNKSVLLAVSSGLFLALAGLARLDSLFGPIGFFFALAIVPLNGYCRSTLIRNILIALTTFTIVYLSVLRVAGLGIEILYDYFLDFVNAGQKSAMMSLVGVVTFGGTIYLVAIAGLFSKHTRFVRFILIWLTITALPALFITSNYMIEPRYLIQSLLPLCALGALGIDIIKTKLDIQGKNWVVLSVTFLMLAMSSNYIFVRLMPYELNRPALLSAVAEIEEIDPNAIILVPWSYTDYNFLRLVAPDKKIFNINSSVDSTLGQNVETEWKSRFKDWYGGKYVAEQTTLDELITSGPVFYLGWRVYPPVQNIRDVASRIGWERLLSVLDNLQLKDHRKTSWLWHSPEWKMLYKGRSGQYEYYLVEHKKNETNFN